jgi:hypothetical protein
VDGVAGSLFVVRVRSFISRLSASLISTPEVDGCGWAFGLEENNIVEGKSSTIALIVVDIVEQLEKVVLHICLGRIDKGEKNSRGLSEEETHRNLNLPVESLYSLIWPVKCQWTRTDT